VGASECEGEAMMEHKGYAAGPIDFDPDGGTFSGTVAGLSTTVVLAVYAGKVPRTRA
jgi:hypothetical protein